MFSFSRIGVCTLLVILTACGGEEMTGPEVPGAISLVSGNNQTGTVGTPLRESLVVRVTSSAGRAMANVGVSWTVTAGGGGLSATSTQTDGQGRASVTWTLGTQTGTNNNTATATVSSLSPVTFTASATAGSPAQMTLNAGDSQTGLAGTTLPVSYSVKATDQYGNPTAGVNVSWSVESGGGSISPTSSTTDASGVASADRTLGASAGTHTAAASVSGLTGSPVTFTATATPNATVSGMVTLVADFRAPPRKTGVEEGLRLVPPAGQKASGSIANRPPMVQSSRFSRRPEFVPDELIVTFRSEALAAPPIGSAALASPTTAQGVSQAIRANLASMALSDRADIAGVSPAILAARIQVADTDRLQEVADEFRRNPAIATVERNPIVYLERIPPTTAATATQPNDPFYPLQAWHYAMIDLPQAWDITTGSPSVLVAVVDDGIRFDHPAIAANLTSDGYDFVSDAFTIPFCSGGSVGHSADGDGYDPDPTNPADYIIDPVSNCITGLKTSGNHGLHVAGTIGAVGDDGTGLTGVNWTVSIRPVRVCGVGGCDYYDIAQGILYAAGLPADDGAGGTVQAPTAAHIINMSLGGPTPSTDLENAVIAASNAGALLVAASGNTPTSDPNYPAAYSQTLSVSAVGPDGVIASYSSFGTTIDLAGPGGDLVDGDATFGVWSTAWDYTTGTPIYDGSIWNGTSMAAPHVSGVAALLLAQDPSLTAADLKSRLTSYAVDVGTPGRDDFYGAGIVNARNSLMQSFAPPRDIYARLFDASTGEGLQTVSAQPDGSYQFTELPDADHLVFAGEDERGDAQIGIPGRRWGAYGGSATPAVITVSGSAVYPANFDVGLPIEVEPNDGLATADALMVGGYLFGQISAGLSDVDVSRVQIPADGTYTFETSAADGACGFALEEDTILELYDESGGFLLQNDDIDAANWNYCSRITTSLTAGSYYIAVWGYYALRYRVYARAGG